MKLLVVEDESKLARSLRAALETEQDALVGVVLISCLTRLGVEVGSTTIEGILGLDFGAEGVKGALRKLLRPVAEPSADD